MTRVRAIPTERTSVNIGEVKKSDGELVKDM
jgi:hypothetical protein